MTFAEFNAVVYQTVHRNAEMRTVGMIAIEVRSVCHVLEGQGAAYASLYERICRDACHDHVVELDPAKHR